MKSISDITAAILFLPCILIGFLWEAGSAGFHCGQEIFNDAFNRKTKP